MELSSEEEELVMLTRKEVALVQHRNKLKDEYDRAERELHAVQEQLRAVRERIGYKGFGTLSR